MVKERILFFVILISTISIVNGQDLNDGLLAKYEFNGNADDTSGNGQHASANATLATDRFGNTNSCLSENLKSLSICLIYLIMHSNLNWV